VIDGSLCSKGPNSIKVTGKNTRIEGVIVRNSPGWTIPIVGADQVEVKNVKLIGYRGNSDGIDVNDSRDVSVTGCYLRTADDLVTIKTKIAEKGETHNVTVSGCVLWNEVAHGLTVGQEIRVPVENILFSDCDVIHDKGRDYLLEIQQADAGTIKGVTYDKIRIEECRWLISLWIGTTMFGHDPERGHIDDVTFRNIDSAVPGRATVPNHPNSYADFKGFDADHAIHGVTLDHITIGGQPLQASQVLPQAFVDGVSVTP
jgi:polygalacturonase